MKVREKGRGGKERLLCNNASSTCNVGCGVVGSRFSHASALASTLCELGRRARRRGGAKTDESRVETTTTLKMTLPCLIDSLQRNTSCGTYGYWIKPMTGECANIASTNCNFRHLCTLWSYESNFIECKSRNLKSRRCLSANPNQSANGNSTECKPNREMGECLLVLWCALSSATTIAQTPYYVSSSGTIEVKNTTNLCKTLLLS